jgi:hypothetical protein
MIKINEKKTKNNLFCQAKRKKIQLDDFPMAANCKLGRSKVLGFWLAKSTPERQTVAIFCGRMFEKMVVSFLGVSSV